MNNDPAQALQGRTAGLTIKPANGQPGANSAIAIRGINTLNPNQEPLYVIDGVPMDSASARSLNSSEIKSITVLKDASATAIYGSRAANGVIIMNTKDGKGLSAKERRKMRREQRKASKEASASQKDFEKAQEEQRRADEAEERERQNAFEAEQKRRMTEKIKVDREEYESFEENKFENPATAPLSTFSIDVDNASYTNIRRFINNGETVPKDAVRVEEMINFFKYSYPQPTGKNPFSINTEYSDCPWNPQHRLLKIGLQGKDIPQAELPASNFVFLIDVSGSMDAQNKLPLLKESMKILVKQMRAKDRIAIVVYAGAAGMVLPSTSGSDKPAIIAALDKLSAGGSTAGGAGIELAYKTAQEHFIKGGNNRVILATDGDFNVGASSDKDMQTLIEEKRKSGVFLTCLGYGMGNYKDSKLETLSDKGNGNYAYIDNMDEADRFLDKEFRGSMYAIAKDVKIQIEFNPNHVQAYRLIGYENRKLRNEDFTNDAIDAGELGSGHTVTALYEIIPPGVKDDFTTATDLKYSTVQPTGTKYSSELATVKFRYKKPDGDTSTEMVQIIPDTAQPLMNATGDFKFAAAVAWFGLKLRDSNLVPNKDIEAIKKLAKEGRLSDPEGYRAEFIRLAGRIE
ncbi:YfbK domain-containing protein [Flavobacterium psychrotrophum]|uniref:YfbK domain-containing protein n=1 Tax=Flavobacterium psychrotrophum TaxID=2294119 RepID=UPI003F76F46D